MPFRTKDTYSTSRGTFNTRKHTFEGKGPAPAGSKKIRTKTYKEVPTVTTSPTGRVTTSGFSAPSRATQAKRQVRSSQRRVRRIERQIASAQGYHRRTQARASQPPPPRSQKVPLPTQPSPKPPSFKPIKFQGVKTAGAPTLGSLRQASKTGTLKLNQQGYATTPQVRKVSGTLERLESRAAKHTGPLPGLTAQQSKVARTVLRRGDKADATRKEELAAAETGLVESSFQDLPGGDADSEGWRQERTSIYGTGPTGPRNVKKSADRFYEESISDTGGTRGRGETAGELAQTIQGSAFPERYDERKPEANAIVKAFGRGGLKPPQQRKLRRTQVKARKLGLKVSDASGVASHQDYLKIFGKQVTRELHLVKKGDYEKGPGKLVVGSSDVHYGHEPEIAARLKLLSAKLGKPIYIISGHRTPQHSVEVGGFSDDPHTEGKAADIGVGSALRDSAGTITEAQYESVGLHRPYYPASSAEINHVELLNGGTPATGGGSDGSVTIGGSTALPSGAISSYAAATGQSPKAVRERLKRGKLGPQQILKKLKELGAGLGESAEKASGATEDKGAILAELERRYGAKAA